MFIILLKSSICLLAFLLFYTFILEKENMHVFKRGYLLVAVIAAITIPFITFTRYINIPHTILESPIFQENLDLLIPKTQKNTNYLPYLLWGLYGIITLFFASRFMKNLFSIWKNIKDSSHLKTQYSTLVLVAKPILPQTFFNYIFLNKEAYETNLIPETILQHETTHAIQKHSIDVLFVEILLVLFWFNPLLYFLKNAIKLNHEFLADQSVLQEGHHTQQYQKTLLAFSSNPQHNQLANAINYSSIKKRLTIMKTQTTTQTKWIKTILIAPLFALLLFSFSNTKSVQVTTSEKTIIQQQKATPAQITEYNALAKKYNAIPRNNLAIKLKDIQRLRYLYGLMTKKQKANAEPFPNFPPAPPAPKVMKGEKSNISPPPPMLPTPIISSFNGIESNGNLLEFTYNEIEKGIVSVKNYKVKSFNIKFPGKPTVRIVGNVLNDLAKKYLKENHPDKIIQIFNIKIDEDLLTSPIIFKIKK